jgi:hypothetical protein
LPENSKKIPLSPLLLSLIVAQVDEAAEATKDISLSVCLSYRSRQRKEELPYEQPWSKWISLSPLLIGVES